MAKSNQSKKAILLANETDLILIDVINDFNFPEANQLLEHAVEAVYLPLN